MKTTLRRALVAGVLATAAVTGTAAPALAGTNPIPYKTYGPAGMNDCRLDGIAGMLDGTWRGFSCNWIDDWHLGLYPRWH
jgi:hypothetical protein